MEKITFTGRMFAIVEKYSMLDGKERVLEVARRAPGTRLIIETPDGSLLLSKEFRSELDTYDMRLPGGKVFDALKEYQTVLDAGGDLMPAIEAAARREAMEEMGVRGGEFTLFAKSVAGLTVEWDLYYFVVKNGDVGVQELEEGEDIEVVRVSKADAKAMCLDGRMSDERSALILLRYLNS